MKSRNSLRKSNKIPDAKWKRNIYSYQWNCRKHRVRLSLKHSHRKNLTNYPYKRQSCWQQVFQWQQWKPKDRVDKCLQCEREQKQIVYSAKLSKISWD
jgi:hypothetical protein